MDNTLQSSQPRVAEELLWHLGTKEELQHQLLYFGGRRAMRLRHHVEDCTAVCHVALQSLQQHYLSQLVMAKPCERCSQNRGWCFTAEPVVSPSQLVMAKPCEILSKQRLVLYS